MDLFLGAIINRRDPQGRVIQLSSRAVHGSRADGQDHWTHVFVAARDASIPVWLRLDGDAVVVPGKLPRATFEAWSGRSITHVTRLWRVPGGGDAAQFGRFWRLAEDLPPYDWGEIAGEASRVVIELARELLPFLPDPGRARDDVACAMICTRLAATVLGVETPTLFPEALVRHAEREGWEAFNP
jgi:hypothetical protein